jgi:hypothetical protein
MRWVKLAGALCAILIVAIELAESPLFRGSYDAQRVWTALVFGVVGAGYLLDLGRESCDQRVFFTSTALKLILGPLVVIVGVVALMSAAYPKWFWLPLCALFLGGLWVVDGIQSLRRGKPTSSPEATSPTENT